MVAVLGSLLVWAAASGPVEAQGLADVVKPFPAILKLVEQAAAEQDAEKAKKLFYEGSERFLKEVQGPLNAFIADRNAEIKKLQAERKEVPGELLRMRDQGELTRIKIHLVFARAFPAEHTARKKLLEEGTKQADEFVDMRFNFPLMQFDGQLQRGILAFEQGLYGLAVDHLSILFDPLPFEKPTDTVLKFLKNLRLQALLFGARALNSQGNFERAGRTIQDNFIKDSGGEFSLKDVEDDQDLRPLAVQVRLEYAVALAGVGKFDRGLEVIHEVIDRYSKEDTPEAKGYITDAQAGLGRMATLPGVELRGKDYYEAGRGLKASDWPGALVMFQRALAEVGPRETAEVAPLCLNEIGEINFLLGREAQDSGSPEASTFFLKSALAYREIYKHFSSSDAITKAATNYLAAATRAVNTAAGGTSHAGLKELEADAKEASARYGQNIQVAESLMQEAQRLEQSGELERAKETYLQVPSAVKGLKVPFYWRAQASARACVHRLWERAPEDEKPQHEAAVKAAIEDLPVIIQQGLADGDVSGAAVGSLTLGLIHYQQGEWAKSAEALEVFTKDLAEAERAEQYRCAGWGYLALAHMRLDDCTRAETVLKKHLFKACKEEDVVSVVAFQLSECYRLADDFKKAALFMRLYALHPASAEDMTKLNMVLVVIQGLIRGGGESNLKAAQRFISKAKTLARKKEEKESLEQTLAFFQAEIFLARMEWDKGIEALEQYIDDFKPRGTGDHDAQVYRQLAEAYWKRRRQPTTKDAQKAEKAMAAACGILNAWRKKDEQLDREFWNWALLWLEMKEFLAKAGDASKYGEIVLFVDNRKHLDMGGPKTKARFLALESTARAKIGNVKGN